MTKRILLLCALALMAHSCNNRAEQKTALWKNDHLYDNGTVQIAGQTLNIDLAQTALERSRGLSGRSGIDENQAMLFTFDQSGLYAFWMKDMQFPIDIVWVKNDKIVEMALNVPDVPNAHTNEDYPIYKPKSESDKVLELSAGWAERHKLMVGDEVLIKLNK